MFPLQPVHHHSRPTNCRAMLAESSSALTTIAPKTRQRRRRSPTTQHDQQHAQLAKLAPLVPLLPQQDSSAAGGHANLIPGPADQHQRPARPVYTPIKPQEQGQPGAARPLAHQAPLQAAHPESAAADDSTAPTGRPAWAAAVDRRLASLQAGSVASSHTRSARTMRWARQQQHQQSPQAMPQAGRTAPGSSSGRLAGSSLSGQDSSSRGQVAAPLGVLARSSVEEYLEGGELSAEGEQQLCLAYQRYLRLQQVRAQPYAAQALLQPQGGSQQQAADALADLLQDPDSIQREGLLAQELLLEVYEPLLVSRAKRAQSSHADYRELLSAARQGLLRAAARFDAGRVGGGVRGARLAALADRYIKNALRDVLTEYQTAAVHVPSYLREVAAKLYRVKQQLQRKQQGAEPSLADIAAAAGVSLKQAEQALQATNGSLQAVSLQAVSRDKEDRGKAGSGVDLQQVDVSQEEDSHALSGVVGAGGLAAARSGLQEEVDAAAERAALEDLLQGLMQKLQPQDRQLLQLKLEGGNISQAARELGKTKQWGSMAVEKVVRRLREDVKQQAKHDAVLAALLKH